MKRNNRVDIRHLLRPAAILTIFGYAFVPAGIADDRVSFEGLGGLPGSSGETLSVAIGVSHDGATVVGEARQPDGFDVAFRWTSDDGLVTLGTLSGGSHSRATDSSNDGTVIVGRSDSKQGFQAFRWSSDAGMVPLGGLIADPPMQFLSQAEGVSGDGSVVVGAAVNPKFDNGPAGPGPEAVRWMSESINGLSQLSGGINFSWAFGVSDDGTTVVGLSASAIGEEPFRWTVGEGMIALDTLPGESGQSGAIDVSADGSVVVGRSSSSEGTQAFRWTAQDGTVGLGYLPGGDIADSSAQAVSSDGAVVVGRSSSARSGIGSEAFIWTESAGMKSIRQILLDHGVAEVADWSLVSATDIAGDGRTIVGIGQNPDGQSEAWIAVLPGSVEPADLTGDGLVDVSDLLVLLSMWGACPDCDADLNGDDLVNVSDLLQLLAAWGPND